MMARWTDLAPDDCRVWLASLREPTREQLAWLSASELSRADQFQHAEDRRRSLAGAVLLRTCLGEVLGSRPADVVVERRCFLGHTDHGRPSVHGLAIGVSLSHAGDLLAVAVTAHQPVGVDVEQELDQLEDGVLDQVVADGEQRPSSTGEQARAWVRKEAIVKATGEGLLRDLRTVAVGPGPAARWQVDDGPSGAVSDLGVPRGYRAAVAVVGPAPRITVAWR